MITRMVIAVFMLTGVFMESGWWTAITLALLYIEVEAISHRYNEVILQAQKILDRIRREIDQ